MKLIHKDLSRILESNTKSEKMKWRNIEIKLGKTKNLSESSERLYCGAGEIRTRVQIRKHRTVYMLSHLLFFRSEYAG
jgi:hypothetical protein